MKTPWHLQNRDRIRVEGKTKKLCLKKVLTYEKAGFECMFPIKEIVEPWTVYKDTYKSGKVYEGTKENYTYMTIMKRKESANDSGRNNRQRISN